MTSNVSLIVVAVILELCSASLKISAADATQNSDPLSWAAPSRENRPWTRWWWMGNAVDKTNLTHQLEMFKEAGIGGVEICPIYGAHGFEDRFIPYLSPEWMEMLAHTTREASRLGLGVDLTTGTGWPFGGERVTPELASGSANMKRFEVAGGTSLTAAFPKGRLQTLRAIGEDGTQIDLTDKVNTGHLDWIAPPGTWRLYGIWEVSPAQKVKRAAPGGVGSVLDPFSTAAMDSYLADFDEHFKAYRGAMPRSQFHDSYEYYNADWTPAFLTEFAARRGYDLGTQLPALFGEGPEETAGRVRSDYRQTMADLHLAYIQHWTAWSHRHGSLSRDQAHGSPANLLDVYGAADIPETEMMPFGGMAAVNYPMNKFSSSAARDKGSALASSESFTWLTEHFNAPLSLVKQAADYLFLTGVNHIFFHGIPYSPAEAPWPGWQFYAAVNFGPYGGLWHDQSVLQAGAPANDVLVYYNIFDVWDKSGELTSGLIIQNPLPASLKDTAMTLLNRGYGFDYISDRFLTETKFESGHLMLGGNPARVILVPPCRLMPAASLEKLIALARDGANIIFVGNLPGDVPGLADLQQQRARFKALMGEIKFEKTGDPRIEQAKLGSGFILFGSELDALLAKAGVSREPMMDLGVWFVRRASAAGLNYFLANRGDKPVDQWVTLGVQAQSAVLLDPRFDHRAGESRILRTFAATTVTGPAWSDFASSGLAQNMAGTWEITFVEGGPALPSGYTTTNLASWTTRDDPEAKRFAGTARYTITFDRPAETADDWILDLGQVREAARVKVNGHAVGALWCEPYQIAVGPYLQPGQNTLEVEVTNLAANRIRDLDLRKVKWKYFYDANLAARRGGRGGLDASDWPLRDSGLLGPVHLQPVKKIAWP
jgi:hypothetical protein